jgi:hypothetical protein
LAKAARIQDRRRRRKRPAVVVVVVGAAGEEVAVLRVPRRLQVRDVARARARVRAKQDRAAGAVDAAAAAAAAVNFRCRLQATRSHAAAGGAHRKCRWVQGWSISSATRR